jgi:hypothetical protein
MKKTLIVLILFVVVLVGLTPSIINAYLNKNADQLFREMILKVKGFTNHEVNFEGIEVFYDFKGTTLSIERIAIHPKETHDTTQSRVVLSAEHLEIKGFNWFSYVFQSSININSASLGLLNVISFTPDLFESQDDSTEKEVRYRKISLGSLTLKTLNFQNKSVVTDSLRLRITNAALKISQLVLLPRHIQHPHALFQISDMEGKVEEMRMDFDNFHQKIILHGMAIQSTTSSFSIAQAQLFPALDPKIFEKTFPYRKEYISFSSDSITGVGIDWHNFFDKGELQAHKLVVNQPELSVFVNKQKPRNPKAKKLMFNQQIKNWKMPLVLDTLLFRNAEIKIEEVPEKPFYKNGILKFSQFNIDVYNLSNQSDQLEKFPIAQIHAKGKIMGGGDFKLYLTQNLADENGAFEMQGQLGKMELSSLNGILEAETQVSIKEGLLQDLSFQVHGNSYSGKGELIARYNDLSIAILGENEASENHLMRQIKSLLANTFLVKSNNPTKRGDLVKGPIYYERNSQNSNINYWWRLILSGIKSTLEGQSEEKLREQAQSKAKK